MGKVTLKEIAEKCGVSVSTVSRILSGDMSRKSSDETTKSVIAVAKELGYVESRTRRIRTARAPISICTVFLSDNESIASEFFQGIISGIEKELLRLSDEYNLQSSLATSSDSSFPSSLNGFDAAIILGRGSDETIKRIKDIVPITIYAGLNSMGAMDEILSDARTGMADAVRYLFHKGRRRIAYIGPAEKRDVNEHRFLGFLEGLESVGLGTDVLYENVHLSAKDGYDGTMRLLERTMPDAIVAANDNTAVGILRALKEKGIIVPGEVMLTGFDNAEASAFLDPPLTTFDVPTGELGRFAAKLVVDRCINSRNFDIRVTIPYRLVERESTEG